MVLKKGNSNKWLTLISQYGKEVVIKHIRAVVEELEAKPDAKAAHEYRDLISKIQSL